MFRSERVFTAFSAGFSMIDDVVAGWMRSSRRRFFCCHRLFPARTPQVVPFPRWVSDRLRQALDQVGVCGLFSHQRLCDNTGADDKGDVCPFAQFGGENRGCIQQIVALKKMLFTSGARVGFDHDIHMFHFGQ